jgi:hypothetical protein
MNTKKCIDCRQDLPLSSFSKSGKYLRSYCRQCSNKRCQQYGVANRERRNARLRKWRRRNVIAARAKDLRARLMKKYSLTPDAVEVMRKRQKGRCLICLTVTTMLVVDHCHKTERVRGLLCRSCNTFLGRVEANPKIMARMKRYVAHRPSRLTRSNNTAA